ncbi:MAG: enoyl-CoA hydratase/isomerase family protein [Acholeplasmataceae bacterium]|nr:enoyl-CoA hydratase/isomerase family protein [Acholeplasmataceae bacterium]
MHENKEILIEVINHIGIIKLNRKNALNALSFSMITKIKHILNQWIDDSNIYIIYISSLIEKAFSVGGDVKKLYHDAIKDDIEAVSTYLSNQYAMDYIIQTYPKPIITYVDGYIFGGGVGLAIGSKYFITSEKTKFAMPETQIGFFPDVGASYFLNTLPNHIGRYIGLLGHVLGYNDLIYLKIADFCVTNENWDKVIDILYKKKWIKEEVDFQIKHILATYSKTDVPESYIEKHETHIKNMFSYATVKQMIEHMSTTDTFSKDVHEKLINLSPTALDVTLELLKQGENKDLLECLKMEHDLSLNVVKTHDFKEGVRSLLVDKDKRYNWMPKSYEHIKYEEVQNMFTQTPNWDVHPIEENLRNIRNEK